MLLQSKSSEGPKLQIPTSDNFLRFNAPDQLGGSSKGFRGRLQWSVACFGAGGTTWVYKYYPKISQAFPSFSFIRLTVSMFFFPNFWDISINWHRPCSGLWSLCHRGWHPHGLSQSSATGTSRHVWKTRCWGPQEYHGIAIAWCQKRPAVVWKRLGLVCARENQLVCACGSLTRPCTRVLAREFPPVYNGIYATLLWLFLLYYIIILYATSLYSTVLCSTTLGVDCRLLSYFSTSVPLHCIQDFWDTSLHLVELTLFIVLYSSVHFTLRYVPLLYCTVLHTTLLHFTSLYFLYSTLTLFYSTPVKFTLLYFALYKHSTLLGLWASDFWATCRLPACVCTWSVCSACVCKGTWTLLAPTPPHPQPRMISVQCLRLQVNMNVIGTPPQSTPTPTPPHPCVHRWVKLCVRRWVKKEMG